MVRAPCCEKMGLKKGPWTRDEDLILINHVTLYGHGNWRALPKQAGLLRCGKSCRLRWANYLSPDIKRGNFSQEEENTIINLHQLLGNRWSAIAAKLPGRTDNEIKNVWHTHLKKRINNIQENNAAPIIPIDNNAEESRNLAPTILSKSLKEENICQPNSPQQQQSSITTAATSVDDNSVSMNADALTNFLEIDDTFWSEVFSGTENSSAATSSDFAADNSAGTATSEFSGTDDEFDLKFLQFGGYDENSSSSSSINMDIGAMDNFWYNMLTNSSGQLPQL